MNHTQHLEGQIQQGGGKITARSLTLFANAGFQPLRQDDLEGQDFLHPHQNLTIRLLRSRIDDIAKNVRDGIAQFGITSSDILRKLAMAEGECFDRVMEAQQLAATGEIAHFTPVLAGMDLGPAGSRLTIGVHIEFIAKQNYLPRNQLGVFMQEALKGTPEEQQMAKDVLQGFATNALENAAIDAHEYKKRIVVKDKPAFSRHLDLMHLPLHEDMIVDDRTGGHEVVARSLYSKMIGNQNEGAAIMCDLVESGNSMLKAGFVPGPEIEQSRIYMVVSKRKSEPTREELESLLKTMKTATTPALVA